MSRICSKIAHKRVRFHQHLSTGTHTPMLYEYNIDFIYSYKITTILIVSDFSYVTDFYRLIDVCIKLSKSDLFNSEGLRIPYSHVRFFGAAGGMSIASSFASKLRKAISSTPTGGRESHAISFSFLEPPEE